MTEEYFKVEHLSLKDIQRIFSKIEISKTSFYNGSPCWEWKGFREEGYGKITFRRKSIGIHRLIYAWLIGPLHPGMMIEQVDHLCRNPPCWNPAHLEAVPPVVNFERSQNIMVINGQKTHCPHGHPYEGDNLIINSKGSRVCRTCRTLTYSEFYSGRRQQILEDSRQYRLTHGEDLNRRRRELATVNREEKLARRRERYRLKKNKTS